MLARIWRSLDLMLADYRPNAKSKHWSAFFTNEMTEALRSERELARFRSSSSPLSTDMEEKAHWFRTADAYQRFLNETGTEWFDGYSECGVGQPQTHRIAGRRVNFHDILLCRHLYAISSNIDRDPRAIVEIGGGFGGLAHKLKKRFRNASIVSLDLPEAITLQSYYLWQLHPGARFYLYDDFVLGKAIDPARYDFLLLPGWLAPHFEDDSADLFINIRSMMEMDRGVIAAYFGHIHRCLRPGGHFYNANRYRKDTVGESIRLRDYPYDGRWSIVSSQQCFLQPHIHELIARRTVDPALDMRQFLTSLPEDRGVIKDTRHRSLARRMALLPLALGARRAA